MAERLRKETTAIPGESGRGLLARALGAHNIPNSWIILQKVGLAHRNRVLVTEDADVDIPRLEHLIHVDGGELANRRIPPAAAKHRDFHGICIHDSSLETRVRRFSPAALAAAAAERPPHMRALWELRDLPYCIEGWDILQDTCGCGVKQGWTRITKIDRCDDCGRHLVDTVASIPVPEELRHALALPALLASPVPADHARARALLPEAIANQDRDRLYHAFARLRSALQPLRSGRIDDDLLAIHAAAEAIMDWPRGVSELSKPDNLRQQEWWNRLDLYRGLGEHANRFAQRGKGNFDPETSLLGARPASELTKIWVATLLRFHKQGAFTGHERLHGTRLVPAFDRAELLEFAPRYLNRLSQFDVATRLGITLYGVEQLVALGAISPTAPTLSDEQPFYGKGDLQPLLDAIAGKSCRKVPCPIQLRAAAQVIGGRRKDWGAILFALSRGQIAFTLSDDGDSLVGRIDVAATDVERIAAINFETSAYPAATFSPTMPKRDALDTLNLAGNTPILDGVPYTGVRPKAYAVKDVVDLAETCITMLEVARRGRVTTCDALRMLNKAGVTFHADGRWDRREAQEKLF
jgi:hypothetical protein